MVLLIFRTASILTLLSSVAFATTAIGPSANLYIVNRDIKPDGFWRSAVLAGATKDSASFPGPLIKGYKGDRFQLNVINLLTDEKMNTSTSIHWHGIFQHGSSWADGTAFVTQCPILTQDSFLYEFTVPDQAGTYWYHSHLSTQYCDGLRGPLVVYDRKDPHRMLYDVDNESTIITLADWYHTPAPKPFPVPSRDSTLINGLGRYINGNMSSPLAVVAVTQGLRYRFRLISTNCDGSYIFSIDGHPFTIIEVDGVNTEKLVADSIQIFTGQRYSLIVEANQTIGNYWIRAKRPNKEMIDGIDMAILRYDTANLTEPNTKSDLKNLMHETDLHPLENPGAPGGAGPGEVDFALNLEMAFHESNSSYTMNGASFTPPSLSVLLQILNGARSDLEFLPPGSVYVLPRNTTTVEISIPGGSEDPPHPFHLHGHTFDVVRSAGSGKYNYKNPVRRDVVSTGDEGDNVTFRFKTDNPGPWFLHCHIDWHLEVGMAVVFVEDPDTVASNPPPPKWKDLCPSNKASPAQRPMSMLDTFLQYFSL